MITETERTDHTNVVRPRVLVAVALAALAAGCGSKTLGTILDGGQQVDAESSEAVSPLDGETSDATMATAMTADGDPIPPDAESTVVRLFDASCDATDVGTTCGPPSRPCRLLVDDLIDPGPMTDAQLIYSSIPVSPGLAVGPDQTHVLLSLPWGSIHASRSNGGIWTTEAAPGRDAEAILLSQSGVLRITGNALNTSGLTVAGGLGVWTRSSGGWIQTDFLGDVGGGGPFSTVLDGQGTIHALVSDNRSLGALAWLRWDGAFTIQDIPGASSAELPSIAVSPAGNAQAAFWGSSAQTPDWTAMWAVEGGSAAEAVAGLGSNVLYNQELPFALAIAGGAAQRPHLLFLRRHAAGTTEQAFEVDYAVRDPSAGWSMETLALGDTAEFPTGLLGDGGTGFTTYRPISVLVDDAGGIRLIYAEYSMSVAPAPPSGEPIDVDPGQPRGATVDSAKVHVAWACGGLVVGDSVLPTELHPAYVGAFGPAVVGTDGGIHVVVLEATTTTPSGLVGRYLVLGP